MNPNVKEFIETQMKYIQRSQWKDLFEIWYDRYNMFDVNADAVQLAELFNMFEAADINLIKESKKAREEIIFEKMTEHVQDLQDIPEEKTVTLAGTVNSLRSRLGIGLIELKAIFRNVCQSLNLEPTGSLFVEFKLR